MAVGIVKTTKRPKITGAQLSQLVGIVLAMIIVVLANVAAARRFKRWDWTSNKRYSLTPATIETLHNLSEPVEIWILLGDDPLGHSVRQLLVAYQAETTKLDIHYVDPDRDILALEDIKKRFKIESGRTEQGKVVTDSIAVVARGDKRWFLGTSDLLEVQTGDETRVKPKEERAFTTAIRGVLGDNKTKLCFTTGHGEMATDDTSAEGTGMLKDLLVKDNYEVVPVDIGALTGDPLAGCTVVVIAGLRSGFTKEETERLRTYLLGGGNMLLGASPITGASETGLVPANLDRALAPFGITLDENVIIEDNPELSVPGSNGVRFVTQARPHALTAGLVKEDKREARRIVVQLARSLHRAAEPGSATPSDLLFTSPSSFGLSSIAGASNKEPLRKKPGDLAGPFVIGMASERAKISQSAPHGPRVVVLGSASPLSSSSFREADQVRGAALLVESALSWLAARPQILDVPEKTAVAAGIRISDDDRSAVRRYVVFMMPGTVALLGIVIAWWRRRTEGAPTAEELEALGIKPQKKKKKKKA